MSALGRENGDLLDALGHANAELYLRLAQIVVWAEQNSEIVAASLSLNRLLETASKTLVSVSRGCS